MIDSHVCDSPCFCFCCTEHENFPQKVCSYFVFSFQFLSDSNLPSSKTFVSAGRLAEDYKEQNWASMSELEKELKQMEAQYGEEFGDASESGEEDSEAQDGGD